jgi:hypothetical protein
MERLESYLVSANNELTVIAEELTSDSAASSTGS